MLASQTSKLKRLRVRANLNLLLAGYEVLLYHEHFPFSEVISL